MAIEDDVEFRRALPRDYLDYVGITHSDKVSSLFCDSFCCPYVHVSVCLSDCLSLCLPTCLNKEMKLM